MTVYNKLALFCKIAKQNPFPASPSFFFANIFLFSDPWHLMLSIGFQILFYKALNNFFYSKNRIFPKKRKFNKSWYGIRFLMIVSTKWAKNWYTAWDCSIYCRSRACKPYLPGYNFKLRNTTVVKFLKKRKFHKSWYEIRFLRIERTKCAKNWHTLWHSSIFCRSWVWKPCLRGNSFKLRNPTVYPY